MTREQKHEYLDIQLVNCSEEQKQQGKNELERKSQLLHFDSDTAFTEWVSETKKTYEFEATPDELDEAFKYFRA